MRFSIITCAYNPNPAIFSRVLEACIHLLERRSDTELIVVDNNSDPPLSQNAGLQILLETKKEITLITENKQGQTFARVGGAKVSRGEVIVFADDDNLLSPDYLEQLDHLLSEHPHVSVWGPGVITVEFPEGAPGWIKRNFRHLFQERIAPETKFGLENSWASYYPVGSGMAMRRRVFDAYSNDFAAGRVTAGGRSGDSLLCGEDAQMVWTAVKLGEPAGTSPRLKLRHLIPARRATLGYLSRLQFNIAYSYLHALSEMFPEKKKELKPLSVAGRLRLLARVARSTKLRPLLFYRTFVIESAWFNGVSKWAKDQ